MRNSSQNTDPLSCLFSLILSLRQATIREEIFQSALPTIYHRDHSRYGLRQWEMALHHSGYGLGQWEKALHGNAFSHWPSPYPEWSLYQCWCETIFWPHDILTPGTKYCTLYWPRVNIKRGQNIVSHMSIGCSGEPHFGCRQCCSLA